MSKVKLRNAGDPVEEGCVAVAAQFQQMNVVRVDFYPDDDNDPEVYKSYIVLRGIGQPEDNPDYQVMMDMTHAKSVNLWYEIKQDSMLMVQDLDMVLDLEESLHFFDEEYKASLH